MILALAVPPLSAGSRGKIALPNDPASSQGRDRDQPRAIAASSRTMVTLSASTAAPLLGPSENAVLCRASSGFAESRSKIFWLAVAFVIDCWGLAAIEERDDFLR